MHETITSVVPWSECRSDTLETHVVLLITQRSQVQILPWLLAN
jgi:hypothetical protein